MVFFNLNTLYPKHCIVARNGRDEGFMTNMMLPEQTRSFTVLEREKAMRQFGSVLQQKKSFQQWSAVYFNKKHVFHRDQNHMTWTRFFYSKHLFLGKVCMRQTQLMTHGTGPWLILASDLPQTDTLTQFFSHKSTIAWFTYITIAYLGATPKWLSG